MNYENHYRENEIALYRRLSSYNALENEDQILRLNEYRYSQAYLDETVSEDDKVQKDFTNRVTQGIP